jgi:hypothetical protein
MENRQVLQTTTKWLSESLMGVHDPPRVDPERFFSMIRFDSSTVRRNCIRQIRAMLHNWE